MVWTFPSCSNKANYDVCYLGPVLDMKMFADDHDYKCILWVPWVYNKNVQCYCKTFYWRMFNPMFENFSVDAYRWGREPTDIRHVSSGAQERDDGSRPTGHSMSTNTRTAWTQDVRMLEHCQVSNIRHTKSRNLNVSYLVLLLSLLNPLKPGVMSRMEM